VVYREFKRQNGIVEQNAATGLYAQWLVCALTPSEVEHAELTVLP